MKQLIQRLILGTVVILLAASCEKQPPTETEVTKNITATNFQKIRAGGSMDVRVTQGTGFSVRATGQATDINDLVITQLSGELSIGYVNPANRARVVLQVTMPKLEGFVFYAKSKFQISGFNETGEVQGVLDSETKGTMQLRAASLKIDLQDSSAISVIGGAENLDIIANDGVEVDTYGFNSRFVRAIVMKKSTARVFATHTLNAAAVNESKIYYKGDPGNQFLSELDNSSIIKE